MSAKKRLNLNSKISSNKRLEESLDDIELDENIGFSGEHSSHTPKDGTVEVATELDDFVIWDRNHRKEETPDLSDLEPRLMNTGGNLVPALVRLSKDANGREVKEVIYGGRRFRVCKKHGLPFKYILKKKMSDSEAQQFTVEENKARLDVDPIDESKYFKNEVQLIRASSESPLSNNEIADKINIKRGQLSKYLTIETLTEEPWVFDACPRKSYSDDNSLVLNWSFTSAYNIASFLKKAKDEGDIASLRQAIGNRVFENSHLLYKALLRTKDSESGAKKSPREKQYCSGQVKVTFGKNKDTIKINISETADESLRTKILKLLEDHEIS